ncbi:MAG: TolC family protein [Desulfuromonadales bacterium]
MVVRHAVMVMLVIPMLLLSGCLVRPKPVTENEIGSRIDSDLLAMHKGQEQISAPVSLPEATARALRYNLDYRLKLMEEVLYQKNFELTRFDMLPRLLASAGYHDRSNDSGGSSMSLVSGRESLEPSTSQENARLSSSVAFSWNILDFGISYYKAKQQANQYLISQERRRKVIQNVVQDVRSAYYRALAAQKLTGKCDTLLDQVNRALKTSAEVESKGLTAPSQTLAYQRALLDMISLLVQKRRELHIAKTELAALMNIPPGVDFAIADAPLPEPQPVPTEMARLERTALMFRPELREEDYKDRISQDEAKRLLVGMLPGIEFESALQLDSNTFLAHKSWMEYGVRASWNLMRLLSLPKVNELSSYQKDVDQVRRAALTMAVITQVRIGVQRYDMAIFDYDLASRSSSVDDKLLAHIQSGAKAVSRTTWRSSAPAPERFCPKSRNIPPIRMFRLRMRVC